MYITTKDQHAAGVLLSATGTAVLEMASDAMSSKRVGHLRSCESEQCSFSVETHVAMLSPAC